jgi:ParB family chromosome partitioning protein
MRVMSKQADKMLAESMGRRRSKTAIQEDVADSILGEMLPPGSIELPIDELYRSPFQVRKMGGDDEIESLAQSLLASGMISPIVVRPILNPDADLKVFLTSENLPGKSFEIVTGHHRVLAAMKIGWQMVPAVVKHMSDAQAAIALTADNSIKKDLSDLDRFKSIVMLQETGACKTGREIAATLGVSASKVTQLRAFGALQEEALSIIESSPLTFGAKMIYELVSQDLHLRHPELVIEAFKQLDAGKIKDQSLVSRWITQKLITSKPRTYKREVKIQRPGMEPVRLTVTDGGASIAAQGLNSERLAKLIEENLDFLIVPETTRVNSSGN